MFQFECQELQSHIQLKDVSENKAGDLKNVSEEASLNQSHQRNFRDLPISPV